MGDIHQDAVADLRHQRRLPDRAKGCVQRGGIIGLPTRQLFRGVKGNPLGKMFPERR